MKEKKTISFTMRLEPSLFKKLVTMAQLNGISVNQLIRYLLNKGLNDKNK